MPLTSRLHARLIRTAAPAAAPEATPQAGDAACLSRADAARRGLLDEIAAFMLRHELAITGANLAMVCDGIAGAQPELTRALAQAEMAGLAIDQAWLDAHAPAKPENAASAPAVDRLMDRFEDALTGFATVAQTAQDHTSEQRGALGAHIAAMAAAGLGAPGVPAEAAGLVLVLDLARAMQARFGEIEAAMQRSHEETARLRGSLAEARAEADIDHLTRLPNRRAFERRLAGAVRSARGSGAPLAFALCDIDLFKQVNDRHGHAAGDRVLAAVAQTLREHAGEGGFAARYGGEEFVLMFEGLRGDEVVRRMEATRASQAARRLVNRESGLPFGRITFSVGIGQLAADGDAGEALRRADEALYRAKAAGRNRVVAS